MPTSKTALFNQLKEEGFGVKVTDGGIVAHLSSEKPSRHELVDAVPELEDYPMETVGEGVFISVGEERFSI